MSFEKANLKMKFDIRMLEYNLAQGIITKEELEKHLASLPDESENTVAVTLDDSSRTEEEEIH
jgi:hypothetical protein